MKRAKPSKYRNVPTLVDGFRFDSKLEAARYGQLMNLWGAGAVSWFIRQVPFHLAPQLVYRADFLVVWAPGASVIPDPGQALERGVSAITVEDCKGVLTAVSRAKLKMVKKLYGIDVTILTKNDVRGVGHARRRTGLPPRAVGA